MFGLINRLFTNWYDQWTVDVDERTVILHLPKAHERYHNRAFVLETTEQAEDLHKVLTSMLVRLTVRRK